MKRLKKSLLLLILSVLCSLTHAAKLAVYRDKINEISLRDSDRDSKMVHETIALSDTGRYIDLSVNEQYLKVLLPDNQLKKYMDTQLADGSWPDIDYADRSRSSWQPINHGNRLFHMVKNYYSKNATYYKNLLLFQQISSGLDFWFQSNASSDNWWHNQIGINKVFGPMLLLLYDDLSEEQKQKGIEQLSRSTLGMTGQNKVWLATNVIYYAILTENETLLKEARDQIAGEIFITTEEGIQPDFSYHQHGPQLQFGNYGLAYAASMAYWANVFSGTKMAFSPHQTEILRNYVLHGLNAVVWNGYMDFSACGRQLFKNAQRGKAVALSRILQDMIAVDPLFSSDYRSIAHCVINARNFGTVVSNTFFYRSDIMVHQFADWYVSVRMSSPRVIGTESGNGENLKAYYLADGVTSIMKKGNEYENIFPFWDWRQLPGATIPQSDQALPLLTWEGYRNGSYFVGGASDGKTGVAVFELDRDGVHARKAYFFLPDRLVCLGVGIGSRDNQPLLTSVDQSKLQGEVKVYYKGKRRMLLPGSEQKCNTPLTISHNNLAYHIWEANSVFVSTQKQHGDWCRVVASYPSKEMEESIFKLTFMDKSGQYAYAVFSADEEEDIARFMKKPRYEVLRNDNACQAVSSDKGSLIQSIFYQAGELKAAKERFSLRADCPSVFICRKTETGWTLLIADPTQQLGELSFRVSGQYEEGVYDPKKKTSFFRVNLPAGEKAGSSLSVELHQTKP